MNSDVPSIHNLRHNDGLAVKEERKLSHLTLFYFEFVQHISRECLWKKHSIHHQ